MSDTRIQMGVIGRPHGVRGLLHVHSYTATPADLPKYGPFADPGGRRFTLRWVTDGVAEVSELVDGKRVPVRERAAAEKLVNMPLCVDRTKLPRADEDEFYLADLVGLDAFAPDGSALGRIDMVHDYGAGTSIEIGALIVPFTRACVPDVDLAGRRVTVVVPNEILAAETQPANDRQAAP